MTLELGHTHLKPMLTAHRACVPPTSYAPGRCQGECRGRVHAHVGAFLVCGQISDVRDPW